MPTDAPDLDLGRESGVDPARFRISGRNVVVVGAVIDGAEAYFDNGVLQSKSKPEQGITFGPEVLRAMGGRRVLAVWMAAARDPAGRMGWLGVSVGEMRIDAAKKDGFRDVSAFSTKLTDAAQGRTSVWQMKEPERQAFLGLLSKKPELWTHAARGFRETVSSTIPAAAALGTGPATPGSEAAAALTGPPAVGLGAEGGVLPVSLRSHGREVTVVGAVVDGAAASFDNGVLQAKSGAEAGIVFGGEPLRAMGGKRVCTILLAVARREDGKPGWFGATVSELRIDAAKKEGFRDIASGSLKLNDAARGRVEVWRLKPEEKKTLGDLLRSRADLWEAAFENVRGAFE
jgi:hypothetical protein